ncbi:putative protein kinase RLK-Pelle-LRR-IX family [Helianthus annuus]|uniref:Protein kinase domain-containing protein n=1 Tax=Helianthus annuus TaxID=4232 RepID=A0A9K3E6Q0_HELAN|nr:putative protein kinase RLK-Pelle-LRR-IX family [Helianthus annuus]
MWLEDLKSSNILLSDDFRAKVSDFGPVKLVPDGGKSIMTQVAGTFGYVASKYASNNLFSLYTYICIYIYIYMYVYIYMYIYYGRDKRAGWKRLTFGIGQVKNFESKFYFHIFGYSDIQKIIKLKFLDTRIFGYLNFGYPNFSDFRIQVFLNASNFHTTSLLIATAPVTPSA